MAIGINSNTSVNTNFEVSSISDNKQPEASLSQAKEANDFVVNSSSRTMESSVGANYLASQLNAQLNNQSSSRSTSSSSEAEVVNNPLYTGGGQSGNNPLYNSSTSSSSGNAPIVGANTNPLYSQGDTGGNNPFHNDNYVPAIPAN